MVATNLLSDVNEFLRTEVAPNAQHIDREIEALRQALLGLSKRNWLAMRRPVRYGGPDMSASDFRIFQQQIARTSGALAFLQTQHQSAVSMIASGTNEALKEEYLPQMGDGRKLVGIGFSQLRRGGEPIMRALRVQGGYELNGHVPWVTGWSFYPEFLIGATLPDGSAVFAVVPLSTGPGVTVSSPMKLAAMETAQTVTVDFEKFVVSDSRVAFSKSAGWAQENDQLNIALQGHFAIGCAQGGLDLLAEQANKKSLAFLGVAHEKLKAEVQDCELQTHDSHQDLSEKTTQARLDLRAWAIDLAVRCAHAAVTSCSGAANSIDHPAQRIYREALVYTVSAQTPAIMEATLNRLVR